MLFNDHSLRLKIIRNLIYEINIVIFTYCQEIIQHLQALAKKTMTMDED